MLSLGFIIVELVGLLLRDRRFRVHMGNDTSAWRPQLNGLPQGSVLAQVLFNMYSNDLPVTRGRKFICLAFQGQFFSKLECSLSSDVAQMSHFCRLGMCGMDFSSSVRFRFGFGSVLKKTADSVRFFCRSLLASKKRVSYLSCVCIFHFG